MFTCKETPKEVTNNHANHTYVIKVDIIVIKLYSINMLIKECLDPLVLNKLQRYSINLYGSKLIIELNINLISVNAKYRKQIRDNLKMEINK